MPKAKSAATSKTKLQFLQKPSCTTCRKAKVFLEGRGAVLERRSLDEQPLREAELEELIGERDYILFLSTRNELYRSRKMNENPPARQEAIRLMARNPNLIRRPVVIRGKRIVLGYDEAAFLDLLK
jgi:Spx/MgsR family transcriptional regulator